MAHVSIYGQTLSGKTTLGKKLAAAAIDRGISVLVYDPVYDASWPHSFKTADFAEFLRVYWQSRRCYAFIDEAGDVCGNWEQGAIETATKGRHLGHVNFYLAQRATLVARTIRDQCAEMYLFRSGYNDCKMHAEEWSELELRNAAKLPTGAFYRVIRGKPVELGRLWLPENPGEVKKNN